MDLRGFRVSAAQIRRLPLPMEALRELILTEEALIDPEPYLEKIFSLAEKRKTVTEVMRLRN